MRRRMMMDYADKEHIFKLVDQIPTTFNLTTLFTEVNIPEGVTRIQQRFDAYYTITHVTLPSTLVSIDNFVFSNIWRESEITLPPSLQSIGAQAFRYHGITELYIPDSVTTIGDYAFGNGALTKARLPQGITTLPKMLFVANHLTTLTVPESVTSMYGDIVAQNGMQSLIMMPTTPPTLLNALSLSATCNIYVPDESVEDYKAASGWSDMADRIKPMSELTGWGYNCLIINMLPCAERRAA